MNITKPKFFFKAVFGQRYDSIVPDARYKDDSQTVMTSTRGMSEDDIKLMMSKGGDPRLTKRLQALLQFQANPTGEPITNLISLEEALIAYIGASENKFVFRETEDGHLLPYFSSSIKYTPPDNRGESYYAPYVTLHLEFMHRGSKGVRNITWYHKDLAGKKTVDQLLIQKECYLETLAAVAKWEGELKRFHAVHKLTGTQYRAKGQGMLTYNSHSSKSISMVREGSPVRVVMDYYGDEEESQRNKEQSSLTSLAFWNKMNAKRKAKKKAIAMEDDEDQVDGNTENEDEEILDTCPLPIHPYTQVFDFEQHNHVILHVNNLTEYKYDKGLESKLVLAAEIKELVNVLVDTAAETMQDIVSGKTGGVIVIATGAPGTGKTLTAEVYSERMEKPLYAVQCSQLGTSETALEKELNMVLKRAGRWQAILLIDEADVYVRERGDDIQQNAIVGVFLRLLEYYRGVLFLTSNRAAMIDDAVLSRAIAHLKYELPNAKDLARIWRVLGDNYKAELTDKQIDQLVEKLPKVSGRNVKNLLKLATAVRRKNPSADMVALVVQISKFVDLPKPENK